MLAIYQAGLDTGDASFETAAPDWDAFDQAKLPLHRHVAVADTGEVLGWIAASAVSPRPVYRGVIEHSVYVHPDSAGPRHRGRVAGGARRLRRNQPGIWTIQTGIFPENTSSLRLHHRAGFRIAGIRQRLGSHRGRWRDVTLLERARHPRRDLTNCRAAAVAWVMRDPAEPRLSLTERVVLCVAAERPTHGFAIAAQLGRARTRPTERPRT